MIIDIEFFPGEKTCAQGCPACPLAKKTGEKLKNTTVDENAQKTFSLLESVIAQKRHTYNLHASAGLTLLPEIAHPARIYMARFESTPLEYGKDFAKEFSARIRNVLWEKRIKPKVIGFSIVPKSPIVSYEEAQKILDIIREIKKWHLWRANTAIEVTIRSNLISKELFEESMTPAYFNDIEYLRQIAKIFSCRTQKTYVVGNNKFSMVYSHEYAAIMHSKKVTINNRMIAIADKCNTAERYLDQAVRQSNIAKIVLDFAIAPRGVMFMHSSDAIHNPILWVGHDDFRNTLMIESQKTSFDFTNFVRSMIQQNAAMYETLHKEKKRISKPINNYMPHFQEWRSRAFGYEQKEKTCLV